MLFEGAHSALLDLDHATYPYVASSASTGPAVGASCGVRIEDLRSEWGFASQCAEYGDLADRLGLSLPVLVIALLTRTVSLA